MLKKPFALLLCCAALGASLFMPVLAKSARDTYINFIEAEDCVLDGYVAVEGNAGAIGKMILAEVPNEQSFTVNFDVPAAGGYVIWLKVWNQSQGDNSIFYDYGGEQLVFDFDEQAGDEDPDYFMYNTWYWIKINRRGDQPLANGWSEWGKTNNQCRHTPVILKLEAGENSITFTAREAGHFIDQLIITDDLDYNPADVMGNETYVCGFCNLEHFKLEPYAAFGTTPEQLWAKRLADEAALRGPDEAAPAPPSAAQIAPAPKTSNATMIIFALLCTAALSARAGLWSTRRGKNLYGHGKND
ncbi:MAG: hypothetical protein FWH48_09835 [Oscillospiraceae bacterium]|nr:hypothetical protein [Oscillospiraceae bacterium]MCL2159695.1 hypothetical protein [Oscillospiraceae bacterium]